MGIYISIAVIIIAAGLLGQKLWRDGSKLMGGYFVAQSIAAAIVLLWILHK